MNTEKLSNAINTFGDALASKLTATPGSSGQFISSWGIAHALSMLLAGSNQGSDSLNQLESVIFGITSDKTTSTSLEELQVGIKTLTQSLTTATEEDLQVSDASSAWVKPGLTLQPAFVEALNTYFAAKSAPLTSAKAVNNWVENATKGKIKDIVDESIVKQAALILINAIYFKAKWQVPFPKNDTSPLPFNLLDSKTSTVPMMYLAHQHGGAVQVAKFKTTTKAANIECLAVRLGYKRDQFSAIAAMPSAELENPSADGGSKGLTLAGGVSYKEALSACHSHVLHSLQGAASATTDPKDTLKWFSTGRASGLSKIKVYLPRFEIEYSVQLSSYLQKLGLSSLFRPGDFGQIATDSDGNVVNDLYVSEVIHKVYCKVDEQGTEAAAATAVVMLRAAIMMPQDELLVKFDRPFTFTLVHNETGLALFSGEVYKPEEWKEGA